MNKSYSSTCCNSKTFVFLSLELAYDEKWKQSDLASPLFLQAFNRLKDMVNRELAGHMNPFRKGFNFFSTIKSLLFYRKYLEIYKAYDLSNRVGWKYGNQM